LKKKPNKVPELEPNWWIFAAMLLLILLVAVFG
jgi:hypothetical protein